ncbi:hypothetical protein GCM10010280_08010 [Streptomyces pilosus]|uniref:Uncharacterized protein n=1 Tax=Streptomyces pilosus TaxID=28893 RepID=A0A918BF28_9ACTN|nr:hypothetical protein GCM10010280_08010 [Streptomyces pilosus]
MRLPVPEGPGRCLQRHPASAGEWCNPPKAPELNSSGAFGGPGVDRAARRARGAACAHPCRPGGTTARSLAAVLLAAGGGAARGGRDGAGGGGGRYVDWGS